MINLPKDYLENMQKLLGEEYGEFLRCYECEPFRGLRFNEKKARPETIEKLVREWNLEKIPWAPFGYYYSEELRPGLSPYHDAGVYYIQEPSAMSVCELAGIEKTDTVLDLCAAPGGKSTRAAELSSVLLSNEIIPKRAKILSSNIERMGYTNVIVTSASPAELAACFPDTFDVVICDAPCSGEGMMRRDEIAVSEWSLENAALCVERQREILSEAVKMVKPGGKLVYSTCTFEPSENEEQALFLTGKYKEFRILTERRFWPHREKGEGHYVCVFEREGEREVDGTSPDRKIRQIERRLSAANLHILRAGLPEGETLTDKRKQKVYIPAHAEIKATSFAEAENGVNLTFEEDALRYLRGEELRISEETMIRKGKDGFQGIYFDGYPLGLSKRNGNTIKNHLPKGLRRMV